MASRRTALATIGVGTGSLIWGSHSRASASAAGNGRQLPERFQRYPFSVRSLTVGYPNRGFQVRAKRLRETEHLKIKASSVDRCFGHPALVLMLRRSARDVAKSEPGSVMLVGDLSRQEGGPLHGHFSHQTGRDADIGFYAKDRHGKQVLPDNFLRFRAGGVATNGSGLMFDDYRNWLLVQGWVRDQRAGLSHIFVSSALRQRLLSFAAGRRDFRPFVEPAAKLLKQPDNASAHDDHFHVRISCPKEQVGLCKGESRR